ncbi:MAG: low molecular weight phosphotyrosine protein phosphatase [Fibrobacterales bacterium]
MTTKGVSVLFVCLGNICRSPTADAIAQNLQKKFTFINLIDSAGTGAYHINEPPHHVMQQVARDNGVEMSHLRARQAVAQDFYTFDYVIAMDDDNFSDLKSIQPLDGTAQLVKLLDYGENKVRNVPDPYYGGPDGFIECFEIIDTGVDNFFQYLSQNR